MARKSITRSNSHYYFVTARSNNEEDFYISQDSAWEIMLSQLANLQKDYGAKIAAFNLVGNRYYLLIQTPILPIDKLMYFFMKKTTLKIHKASGRINKIFGCHYKGTLISESKHNQIVFKYISRLPVESKLTDRAEEYPFTTFKASNLPIEIERIDSKFHLNEWVDIKFSPDETERIRRGLYRTIFYLK